METTLEKYIKELTEDVKVDSFNLKDVQMRLPSIKHKWAGRYIRCKVELNKLQKDRENHKKQLIAQLQREAVVKLTDYAAGKTIEDNKLLKDFDDKIEEYNLILEFLDESKKTLSSMTWDISNIVKIITVEQT